MHGGGLHCVGALHGADGPLGGAARRGVLNKALPHENYVPLWLAVLLLLLLLYLSCIYTYYSCYDDY